MDKAPVVGTRVQYRDDSMCRYGDKPRTCTGTVTQVHPQRNAEWDENDEWVGYLPGYAPESEWKVTVKVDEPLPDWWPYGNRLFCPQAKYLEPIEKALESVSGPAR